MHDLCKILRRVLEGDEGVFIDNKDDWTTDEVKQSRALDSQSMKIQEGNCKCETKSSLGLNFW